MTDRPRYTERLWVPWHWWLVAAGFVVSVMLAVSSVLGWAVGGPITALTALLVGGGLLAYGGVRLAVDDDGVRVGRALLEWPWVGDAIALDEEASRDRMGPTADARAWLVVRPYLRRTVELRLDDPDDPHPYWLVGTRRPERFAAAIRSGLTERPERPEQPDRADQGAR